MESHSLTYDETRGMATIAFNAFDTTCQISAYVSSSQQVDACNTALLDIEKLCRVFENLFSVSIPRSDVFRINHAGGQKTYVDPRTADLVKQALYYCEASDGIFDITVAPVVKLWNMKKGIIPDDASIKDALSHVNWRNVQVCTDTEKPWVKLSDKDAMIDLGGIAKGWMADRIGEMLDSDASVRAHLIDLGGNILVGGAKPDGKPWKIGIRDPESPNSPQYKEFAILERGSIVTSGVYERCFEADGKMYHHILDANTGYPAQVSAMSATLVCERSIEAEGFSTTMLILGPERSQPLIETHPEIKRVIFQG